jgi:AbrB family looped-hinge helix DNA binding protein
MTNEPTTASYVGRVGQRRQVVLPKSLCEEVGLEEGDFVEVTVIGGSMVVKPMPIPDTDETLTPREASKLRHGLKQAKDGKTRPWSTVKRELGL